MKRTASLLGWTLTSTASAGMERVSTQYGYLPIITRSWQAASTAPESTESRTKRPFTKNSS